MIRAAAGRLAGKARRTPLLRSPFLDAIAGRPVLVKPECLQHTGSFKFRGAWSAISALCDPCEDGAHPTGVIAYSSGNHAQGVALAAREHALAAVIVMPSDAPRLKIENTRALGAEVVLYDRGGEDRDALGARLARERGLVLIKPFDNPQVIAGQGTVGLEIAAQAADEGISAAHVLVPCGGGGLSSGIALALAADAPAMQVHPVEPAGFDDVVRSQLSGQRETNPASTGSICDAVITPRAGALTWPIIARLCAPGLVVSDDDALRAMAQGFARLKIVAEPGGAIALAAALFQARALPGDAPLIAVVSGGNVDAAMFATALTGFGEFA